MSGKYIVVFKEGTAQNVIDQAAKDVEAQGGKIGHRYDTTMKGFSATVPDNVITTFKAHEKVDYIEADGEVSAYAKSIGIGK
ncbi:protease propeptide/inhibitor [Fimicolochytrium jonesii]|uniref:protease propeptide/inhibitor n=1 Tax=Fimicolochytrium jonesii TaxID=1396493 RepID=UPI0022FEA37F|nr:protease propeptide/inhibitor [Fimicolochytrium jonesii]KAI8822579.1 protease propeptide/inhibitor [Fimicolochytrium jonesii]